MLSLLRESDLACQWRSRSIDHAWLYDSTRGIGEVIRVNLALADLGPTLIPTPMEAGLISASACRWLRLF